MSNRDVTITLKVTDLIKYKKLKKFLLNSESKTGVKILDIEHRNAIKQREYYKGLYESEANKRA